MNVPFCDIGRENRALEPELLIAAARVIRSGRVLYGAELEAFEHEIAAWHGVKHAVGTASGTDAVELALRATSEPLGDGEVDEVSLTAFAPVPCVNAVEAAGCRPRLIDPDADTRSAVGDLHVHMYGLATDARAADVEDCAHAMGAECEVALEDGTTRLMKAGTMGRTGAASFYPSKILGALGDGGVIVTNDDEIAVRARRLRHYGFEENGDVSDRGQNSRLCELQAAFLRVKLPLVHGWIARRRGIADRYTDELRGRVTVPFEDSINRHVHHVYVVEHPERDRVVAQLRERGIGCQVHYDRAIHQYERWKHLGQHGFPVAEKLAATVFSLPCYPYLTDAEQDAVIAAVKEVT